MVDVRITRIEPDDVDGLTRWHGLMRQAYTADRTAPWWQSLESTLTQFAHPRSDKVDIALLAHLGEEAIGRRSTSSPMLPPMSRSGLCPTAGAGVTAPR